MNLVPRNRASVVCLNGDRILTVRAKDPVTAERFLFLPGGGIEPGESASDAAMREAREETGYDVALRGEPIVLDYPYQWAGKMYACHTAFFRAELCDPAAEPAEVHDDDFIVGVEWVYLSDVPIAFAYHELILDVVKRLL